MEVKNLSWDSMTATSNHKLLPKNIRGSIIGKSGCGKTTLLLNLLLNPGWLDYNKLFVFSKSLFQPEYQVLRKAREHKLPKEATLWLFGNQRAIQSKSGLTVNEFIECMAGVLHSGSEDTSNRLVSNGGVAGAGWERDGDGGGHTLSRQPGGGACLERVCPPPSPSHPHPAPATPPFETSPSNIDCCFFENSDEFPDPKELNPEHKNLMVFDDLLLEKQNACENYYARERHSNVDCFYLSHTYLQLPTQTIRENAHFLCLFQQDLKNMSHLYSDHASSDMKPEEFRDMCKKIWGGPHDFTVIDLTRDKDVGIYRECFDELYLPSVLKDNKL